jgi:hypothetical protein
MASGCLADGESSYEPTPWNEWHRAGREPRSIRSPGQWTGGDALAIACTQTELPAREQRALVAAWCEALPTLGSVRRLWFNSRVPQELFDAACRLPGLQGLWLKWNGLQDIAAAEGHATLSHLHLGESSRLASLAPLHRMPALRWFQVDGVRHQPTLEPLRGLAALEGLGFTGGDGKGLEVPSFEPLSGLTGLRWLHLGAVRPADGSLRPLAALTQLRWLGLPNRFEMAEYAALSRVLSTTRGDWLAPFERFHRSVFPCPKCKANGRVMTTGRGSRLLCPDCDAGALAKKVAAWEAARASPRWA